MSARRSAPTGATASASRRWPPPPGRSSSPSPSFARARSSPPCSTPAAGWTRPRCAVICQAWIEGVSTRKAWRPRQGPGQRVGDLQVHGLADPRRASTRACTSSSPGRWTAPGSPTCSPGATYLDVRVGHRVVCRALVVATGVSAQGRREIPEHGPGRRRDGRLPGRPCLAVPARAGAQGPLAPRPRGRGGTGPRPMGASLTSPHDPEGVVLDYR